MQKILNRTQQEKKKIYMAKAVLLYIYSSTKMAPTLQQYANRSRKTNTYYRTAVNENHKHLFYGYPALRY